MGTIWALINIFVLLNWALHITWHLLQRATASLDRYCVFNYYLWRHNYWHNWTHWDLSCSCVLKYEFSFSVSVLVWEVNSIEQKGYSIWCEELIIQGLELVDKEMFAIGLIISLNCDTSDHSFWVRKFKASKSNW